MPNNNNYQVISFLQMNVDFGEVEVSLSLVGSSMCDEITKLQ